MSVDLTNHILPTPCRLASALLRVDTTFFDTGSPLSASSRTQSHCHQTSQSSPSLLPMPFLFLLLTKALAAFDQSYCCFRPKLMLPLTKAPAAFDQSFCCDFWPKLLLPLAKAPVAAFDQSSHYFSKLRSLRKKNRN